MASTDNGVHGCDGCCRKLHGETGYERIDRPDYLELLPKAEGDELVSLICMVETETFDDDEERAGVLEFLKGYIVENRDSKSPKVLVAVASAIRKYVAASDRSNLEWMHVLLEAGYRSDKYAGIEVELEIAKMFSRKYQVHGEKCWDSQRSTPVFDKSDPTYYPGEVARQLAEIAALYLNPRIISKDSKFAATAMQAVEAVLLMGHPATGDRVCNNQMVLGPVYRAPTWFREQLARRMVDHTSSWAERPRERIRKFIDKSVLGSD
jgi:hypothetical protein